MTKLLVKISTLPTHDGERRSIKARTGKKTSELELAETGLQLELVKQLDLDTTLLCSFDENNVKSLKLYEEKFTLSLFILFYFYLLIFGFLGFVAHFD
ncbi:hypothetical protein ES319_D07G240300v1 [Gossypium barbadense]|uniref:Uncharacterized protein n=1 Tax=Gossypium barbadense TaxID=3634 RepID=A0A5J5QW56_GOSBA|nr:hypothetical protein ES319_D07G240300v1 [Gossypium barbadense]